VKLFISEIVHTEDSFLLKLYYKFNFATEPEKTPKWLEERTYGQQLQSDFDPQLEKDKEEFLKQLKLDWEE
ncbi:MAG: hypothetical protein E6Y20_09950, partial [Staphylococcus epidermidis]|nr:hypothetical protein [Staphylococcus epidermidis]